MTKSGKYVGKTSYWRLYAIENAWRIIVHSVLNAQFAPDDWWVVAVDKPTREKAEDRKKDYAKRPWHGHGGNHGVYYLLLSDLTKIIATHRDLFRPIAPQIDNWIAKLDDLRLPRNVVGHMNWPTSQDLKRIDVFYEDLQQLLRQIATRITLSAP